VPETVKAGVGAEIFGGEDIIEGWQIPQALGFCGKEKEGRTS
jgi:hypothetical protein